MSAEQSIHAKNTLTLNISSIVQNNIYLESGFQYKETLKQVKSEPFFTRYLDLYYYSHIDQLFYTFQKHIKNKQNWINIIKIFEKTSSELAWFRLFNKSPISLYYNFNDQIILFVHKERIPSFTQEDMNLIHTCLKSFTNIDINQIRISIYQYTINYPEHQFTLDLSPIQSNFSSYQWSSLNSDEFASLVHLIDSVHPINKALIETNHIEYFIDSKKQKSLKLSISDISTIYRAVLFDHILGSPFISIDPHQIPYLAKVHIGGGLENTFIGSLLLKADTHFKTMTTGIDLTSHKDIQNLIKKHVDDFSILAEKNNPRQTKQFWENFRFWFYPDQVLSEANENYLLIHKTQFIADAQRLHSNQLLPPSIEETIEDINLHYQQYSNIFPELNYLNEIARYFTFFNWVKKYNHQHLFNFLLLIPIQTYNTPSHLEQLVNVAIMFYQNNNRLKTLNICLNPYLNRSVSNFFQSSSSLNLFIKNQFKRTQEIEINSNAFHTLKLMSISQNITEFQQLQIYLTHQIYKNFLKKNLTPLDSLTHSYFHYMISGGIDLSSSSFKIQELNTHSIQVSKKQQIIKYKNPSEKIFTLPKISIHKKDFFPLDSNSKLDRIPTEPLVYLKNKNTNYYVLQTKY